MEKIAEILVIDNDKNFATECVDFLIMSCNIGATYALTYEEAENKLRVFPIKIVLLDYDMPMNGLDMFKKLQEIDKYAEYVFISSVATNDVLYEAEKYSFADKIAKGNCYKELPELIPSLLLKYAEQFNKSNKVFHIEHSGSIFNRNKVEYSICTYNIINKNYVFPDSWHTTNMIRKGEKIEHSEELDYESLFNFSNNFKVNYGMNIGIENNEFETSLLNQLESNIKSEYSKNIKMVINRIRELSLNSRDNEKDDSIVARYYDFANVYFEIKLIINKYCTCCNTNTIMLTTVYFPIPKVSYRIREYFENGDSKIINSGYFETGFSAPIIM